MPSRPTTEEDTYLCVAVNLPDSPTKLVGVEPDADQKTVHHILLMGCVQPVKVGEAWECKHKRICHDQDSVIYGWGRNAEKTKYPKGVAFSVGPGTGTHALVMQVHYLTIRPENDTSGLVVQLANRPSEMTASTTMYAADFSIPPGRKRYPVRNTCCYSGFEPVTTVAFRVHTHDMGRKVFMTKTSGLSPDGAVIADRDPLLPQGFVSVNKPVQIFSGEQLKVTCDFESVNHTRNVVAGFEHGDEMCNMYMVFASEMPFFGTCLGERVFRPGQKAGMLSATDQFTPESQLSNYWSGPDAKSNLSIGQSVSVERAHDGKLWILHRGDRTMDMVQEDEKLVVRTRELVTKDAVLLVDPKTGAIESSWGSHFFSVPHMLTVDFKGNLWITDVGKHQVFRFTPKGELLMTLGTEFTPGRGKAKFCAPTQVAVVTDGTILVADGYCNQRIVRFSEHGEFISEKKDSRLSLPHAVISDECNGVFYVADRNNRRVVAYDLKTMDRLGDLQLPGMVMGLTKGPFDTFLALTWREGSNGYVHQFEFVHNKKPVAVAKWQIPSKAFPHDLALSTSPVELTGTGNRLFALYIAETDGNRTIKLVIHPPDFKPVPVLDTEIQIRSDINLEAPAAKKTANAEDPEKESTTDATNRTMLFSAEMNEFSNSEISFILLCCTVAGLAAMLFYLKRRRRR